MPCRIVSTGARQTGDQARSPAPHHDTACAGTAPPSPARRMFLTGSASAAGLLLAGCAIRPPRQQGPTAEELTERNAAMMYRAMPEEPFPIPAVDLKKVDARYYRATVPDPTGAPPGTVYVDTANFYLYLVQENGMARRYGVGLGRAGFAWSGRARIAWKKEWPTWTPPDEMIARQPELAPYSAKNGGMAPGLGNPLGARALYIFEGKVDTLYRIHGTAEAWSIGRAVSSGCVRLLNQDVIDLYDRVPPDTPIIVA
ncbi:L,D-transpeptidase [Rhodobium gokarnense]|uniref:Lipoprotein-anchoring transpeptidase ErfK/SrfK n=1 Tax=Rhodobium gokarnense TaxID=364296 RepID=A0ABT3HGD5_9HYPH|nr:L,D-transpeptidase [Rhodobium gokarnense]MCW2309394.1 lipoprotein-anchoring transpeptidase ErfK/SrfK [Rhodobium gokarnense]